MSSHFTLFSVFKKVFFSCVFAAGRNDRGGMLQQQCKHESDNDDEDEHQSVGSLGGQQTNGGGHSRLQNQYDLRQQVQQIRDHGQQNCSQSPPLSTDPNYDAQNTVNMLLGMSADQSNGSMRQHLQQHLSHQLVAINNATLLRLGATQQHRGDETAMDETAATGVDCQHHHQVIQNLRAAGYNSTDAQSAARQLLGLSMIEGESNGAMANNLGTLDDPHSVGSSSATLHSLHRHHSDDDHSIHDTTDAGMLASI